MKNTNRRVAWFALAGVLAGGAFSACSDSSTSPGADAGRDAAASDSAGWQEDSSRVPDAAADAGAADILVAVDTLAAIDTLAAVDEMGADAEPPAFDMAQVADGPGRVNPASVNCTDRGGSLDLRIGPGGQYGVCVFKDGSECEEWAFYRGQCRPGDCDVWETCKLDGGAVVDGGGVDGATTVGIDGGAIVDGEAIDGATAVDGGTGLANPASVNCTDQGGSLDIRTGAAGQYGVCVFKDGSECEEWALYRGQCRPGDCRTWEICSPTLDGGTTG